METKEAAVRVRDKHIEKLKESGEGDICKYSNNCKGWNGHSFRCHCGNRRVRWVFGKGGSWYYYAESY